MAGNDNDSGDVLMMVVPQRGGRPVPGESTSVLTPSPLLAGFRTGFMFEIASFKFAVQTTKDNDATKAAKTARHGANQPPLPAAGIGHNVKKGEAQSCPVQPVTFDRPIDSASAILLSHCIGCDTLYGAVVVKRKPAGSQAAGEAYLRFEFIGVLFTSIEWSNADLVTESCTFITRAVNVKYRPQLPNGTLGPIVNGYWSRIPNRDEELVV